MEGEGTGLEHEYLSRHVLADVPDATREFLVTTSGGDRGAYVGIRLLISLAIVVWAARSGRAWLLAPALILACPVLGGFGAQAVLAAIPRLRRVAPRSDKEADAPERPVCLVGATEATVAGAP